MARPGRLPAWALPTAIAVVALAVGSTTWPAARHSLSELADPLGFLLAAVPLAVLLDRLGFFSAVADRVTARTTSTGGLWVLAALVTTVLNLDAGVVLLTPLYVGVARRRGADPLVYAAQPVLLACLASSALPVSNLTNLIAAAHSGAGTAAFLAHLGLPSLVATCVGWGCYRRLPTGAVANAPAPTPPPVRGDDRRALRLGGVVVVAALVGFTAGRQVGVAPWMVALAGDVALVAAELVADHTGWRRALPWRAVPVGTALVAASLAVLATGAVTHLPVGDVIGGTGVADLARTTGAAALGANVANNLPALLVALPATGHGVHPSLWAVLLGVNMGPVLVVTGSLASLLWLDALRRLGVPAGARDFSRFGIRVGLPAGLAGVGTALLLAVAGVR